MTGSQRKVIDCRNFPNDKNCTLALSGTEEEVLAAAILHAVSVHHHKDTPKLRERLRALLKDEVMARAASASASGS